MRRFIPRTGQQGDQARRQGAERSMQTMGAPDEDGTARLAAAICRSVCRIWPRGNRAACST